MLEIVSLDFVVTNFVSLHEIELTLWLYQRPEWD